MVKSGWGQFDHSTLKLNVSQKWADRVNLFFGTDSGELKVDSMIFWWA